MEWSSILILVAIMGAMMLVTILPQRKQKKKMQEMLNSIEIGSKIMTIGGFIGVITDYDQELDRYTINFGTEEAPISMQIIKGAIRSKLDK